MTAAAIVLVIIKVTVVMAIALAGVRLARRSPAAVRHVLLAAGFAALLILPVASMALPSLEVAIATDELPAPVVEVLEATRTVSSADAGAVSVVAEEKTPVSWLAIATIGWIAGLIVFLVPVCVGLWEVRALRRTALPWPEAQPVVDAVATAAGIRRPVRLLLHESLPGPMTCGVAHPVVILPIDAKAWSREDLSRAIVHELEHVRRADWLSQCFARVIAAFYWFHPIVWMAWRKLALEAERACDDAVLRASEATAYADQLVNLAQRLSTPTKLPQLAMANRHDLSTRVIAVLDARQPRGRAGVLCIGAAIAVTAVLATGMSSIQLVAQAVQSAAPSGPKPKYDAATIKRCIPEENPTGARGTAGGTNAQTSPGRFFVPCVTVEQLIYLAYASYGAREDQRLVNDDPGSASNPIKVRGGPDWVHSLKEKYQIEATATGATERVVLMGDMLQSLLEDRFKLKLHRDIEEVPLLSLTVAKSGFKLKPMKEGDCDPDVMGGPVLPGGKPRCGNLNMMSNEGKTRWSWGTGTMSSLAGQLTRPLGLHVIDNTGIKDKFVYVFEFQRGQDELETEGFVRAALDEQLGLKIERTKGPRGFIVIDSIERPTPDGPAVIVQVPTRATGPGPRRR